jgi:hypothetical protein
LGTTLGNSGGTDPGETAKIRRELVVSGETWTSAVTAWSVVSEDQAFIDAPSDAFSRAHALFRYHTAVCCTISVA